MGFSETNSHDSKKVVFSVANSHDRKKRGLLWNQLPRQQKMWCFLEPIFTTAKNVVFSGTNSHDSKKRGLLWNQFPRQQKNVVYSVTISYDNMVIFTIFIPSSNFLASVRDLSTKFLLYCYT